MRLICPNCGAQYEVPDDVMPPDGREVQCSNCEQTWFQAHPDAETAPEDDVDVSADRTATSDPDAKTAPDRKKTSQPDPESDSEEDADEAPNPLPRRPLDQAVIDVLREEAELEKQARQNEATGGAVESQPDLGLDESGGSDEARRRAHESRDRMARMRGEDPSGPVTETTAVSDSRRDMLPDIAEINSTLRSNSDRSPTEDPGQTAQVEARERRSFGRGFLVMVVLVALLSLAYAFAPQIAEAVPQVDPWLSTYVGMIDQWRVWLDGQVQSLLAWFDPAADSSAQ
ncbi:zinc-ribbon domain-containing protein [uncultured Roseobacter sp.]|uniref:zinc-ribbon domain-containing protein n=1 Tax=uncultured Roseobacter sp. TaxID=114847 RepID=UPI002629F287|nr:zinc-ribbon domain-containing protein [uncultured Roseobacter sp.]